MTLIGRMIAKVLPLTLLLAMAIGLPAYAANGDTLTQARTRGMLRCGVSEGVAGFSAKDAAGRWIGIDVDFCRAVAAAALGSADRVTFLPLKASARFPALRTGMVDLLSRDTTWTLVRESTLGVQFAGVLFYDAQALMVPAQGDVRRVADLDGATVCVEKGTSSEVHLVDYFAARKLSVKPLVIDSAHEAADAYFKGRCRAYTADASHLSAVRLHAPGGANQYVILPERIAKEPLGPVVRADDETWLTLVRWVLFSLIAAEEYGVTQSNAGERLRDPLVARVLRDVDWKTLLFLGCIFCLVQAVDKTELLPLLALRLYAVFGTALMPVALTMIAGVGLLSAVLANVPVAGASILIVKGYLVASEVVPDAALGTHFIDWPPAALPVFVGMMFGATLGGNATLIGASANVVSAGICSRHGKPVTFLRFLRFGLPFTVVQLLASAVYVFVLARVVG
jgi:general L-amino acid transport system substrate-binding protein